MKYRIRIKKKALYTEHKIQWFRRGILKGKWIDLQFKCIVYGTKSTEYTYRNTFDNEEEAVTAFELYKLISSQPKIEYKGYKITPMVAYGWRKCVHLTYVVLELNKYYKGGINPLNTIDIAKNYIDSKLAKQMITYREL